MAYNLNITNADCYTGTTTLINKLGITDENELNSTEALITSYKAASIINCLLYTSPSPRDRQKSRMPSSA